MSWDSYITNMLDSGTLTDAAISDLEGNIWARSTNFMGTQQELKNIAAAFTCSTALRANGILIGGKKFMFLRATDDNILGKLKSDGIIAACAKKCILVGIYGEGQQAGVANARLCKMADYLRDMGY